MFKVISNFCTLRFNASHDPSIPAAGLVLRAGVVTPATAEQARYLLHHHPVVVLVEAPASLAPAPEFAPSDLPNASLPEESSL